MRHLPLTISVAFYVVLWAVTTAPAAAQSEPPAKVIPESVQTKGMPGPAKLTLDVPPVPGKELTNAASILVGAEKTTPSVKEPASVTFSPPRCETVGEVDVKVLDAQDAVLATGRMRYVEPPNVPIDRHNLAIFYALVILAFPFLLMLYDLKKAYTFAHETRTLIIGKAAADGLTAEELKLLLGELSQSPPGIPGLARNSIAFMLMMILAVAIVHILAVAPPEATQDIPASIDRILVLLTGLLTSVVSFYFGSRAAETAQQAANPSSPSDTSKPPPITFVPKSAKPGEPVTISGAGFGTEKGTVSFGDAAADMTTAKWADREVTVNVPTTVKPGKVHVILIPKGTDRKLISSAEFEVLEKLSVPSPTDNESDIDGCDVAIADATSDEGLPAAEGGIQK